MGMTIDNHGLLKVIYLPPLDIIGKGLHRLFPFESLWEDHR